jgi:hypothetical protein
MFLSLNSYWGLVNSLQKAGFCYGAIKDCTYDISDHLSSFLQIPI